MPHGENITRARIEAGALITKTLNEALGHMGGNTRLNDGQGGTVLLSAEKERVKDTILTAIEYELPKGQEDKLPEELRTRLAESAREAAGELKTRLRTELVEAKKSYKKQIVPRGGRPPSGRQR